MWRGGAEARRGGGGRGGGGGTGGRSGRPPPLWGGPAGGHGGVSREGRGGPGLGGEPRRAPKREAIGQLPGGIAHDSNNLLTIILANAELLSRGPEEASLRDIISAAVSGRIMVNQLLGFARRSTLTLEPMHLGHLLNDLAAVLRRVLPADIDLLVFADQDLPQEAAHCRAGYRNLLNLWNNPPAPTP